MTYPREVRAALDAARALLASLAEFRVIGGLRLLRGESALRAALDALPKGGGARTQGLGVTCQRCGGAFTLTIPSHVCRALSEAHEGLPSQPAPTPGAEP